MLRIAICDNQSDHSEYIRQAISETSGYESANTCIFNSPQKMLDYMLSGGYAPDIAMIEIRMDEIDGVTLAKRVNALSPFCQIIFLSSCFENAANIYDADHVYFMLKSQIADRLETALNKASNRHEALMRETVVLMSSEGIFRLRLSDIQYMERVLRKTCVRTNDAAYWTSAKPGELLSQVDNSCFFQCHQSFFVNIYHVVSLTANGLCLENGIMIPVSRAYKNAVRMRVSFPCE